MPRKNIIGGLKSLNYGCHYKDEDIDTFYRMQVTIVEIEYILGYEYSDAETIDYEIKPGIYELTDLNAVFPRSVRIKADGQFMKSFLITKDDLIFNSDLNEVLGFTNQRYGTHLKEKDINKKVLIRCI